MKRLASEVLRDLEVRNVDDPRYLTQPEKKANRISLADASYRSLSEGEKEKDRVIARALTESYYMASKR